MSTLCENTTENAYGRHHFDTSFTGYNNTSQNGVNANSGGNATSTSTQATQNLDLALI